MSRHSRVKTLIRGKRYAYPLELETMVERLLNHVPGLRPSEGEFATREGHHVPLFTVKGTVPVAYKRRVVQIPMLIWFPRKFPAEAPFVYVTPTRGVAIRDRHPQVDAAGQVFHPYLGSWSRACSLVELMTMICELFADNLPVYATAEYHQPRTSLRRAESNSPGGTLRQKRSHSPSALPPVPRSRSRQVRRELEQSGMLPRSHSDSQRRSRSVGRNRSGTHRAYTEERSRSRDRRLRQMPPMGRVTSASFSSSSRSSKTGNSGPVVDVVLEDVAMTPVKTDKRTSKMKKGNKSPREFSLREATKMMLDLSKRLEGIMTSDAVGSIAKLMQANLAVENEAKDLEDAYAQLQRTMATVGDALTRRLAPDKKTWTTWDYTSVLCWIIELENGRFMQYHDALREALAEEGLRGVDLPEVEDDEWERWGVNDEADRAALVGHCKVLQPPVCRHGVWRKQQ